MAKLEHLIPYFKLTQVRGKDPKDSKVIGKTLNSITETDYGRDEILGIQEATIKYGEGFVACNLTMPIHQNLLQAVQLDDDSELHKIFALAYDWTIEFGWSQSLFKGHKISGMKLFGASLDYDASLRSFMAKIELRASNNFILGDIKVQMLVKELEEIKHALSDKKNKKVQPEGNPLSIGNILTKILDGCKTMVGKYARGEAQFELGPFSVVNTEAEHEKNLNLFGANIKKPTGHIRSAEADAVSFSGPQDGGKPLVIRDKKMLAYPSSVFYHAKPDDIPNADDIRLAIMGDENLSVEEVSNAFNTEAMKSTKVLDKLTKNQYKDMSVQQFIMELLRDNGFTWVPSWATLSSSGKIEWLIIQYDYNNLGENVEEKEYIGIRSAKSRKNYVKDYKLLNTFGIKNSSSDKYFDLHSNQNIVLSLNASTDQGSSTMGTALASEGMVTEGSEVPAGKGVERFKESLYIFLAQQGKDITFEILGFPELKISDGIYVNLAGDLYSGKYKIIEMEHKIGDSFTTSARAIRIVSPSDGGSKQSTDDQEGETSIPEILSDPKEIIRLQSESESIQASGGDVTGRSRF